MLISSNLPWSTRRSSLESVCGSGGAHTHRKVMSSRRNPSDRFESMKELHSEIVIEASAERVWEVLTNFAAFPQWTPFIRTASGEIRTGQRLEVRMQPSGARAMTFKPKVLKLEPNRELRWRGQLWIGGLFDGEHIFTIEKITPGQVRFVQREEFSRILVPFLARSLDRDTKRGFEEMNQALKSQEEKTST